MLAGELLRASREHLSIVPAYSKLIEAAKLLTSGSEIVIAVDQEGLLQGVVTKSDIVRQMSVCTGNACLCAVAVAMTSDAVVCLGDDRLEDVSQLMRERNLKNIPLVDHESRPLGVLTARAVLRELLGEAKYEEDQLINYVKGIGYR